MGWFEAECLRLWEKLSVQFTNTWGTHEYYTQEKWNPDLTKMWGICHSGGFILISFASVFLMSSFLCERSPLQALSANIWGWRYFTCNNMFCLFLKECENTPVRIKSNNQGQSTHRWKSLGSELHLWECLCHSCLSKQINQPTLVLFYSATAWQLCSHAAFA